MGEKEKRPAQAFSFLPVGIGAGITIGVTMNNIGDVGLAIGAGIGVVLSLGFYYKNKG